jgi:FlaG/FlaF family flagellin (archaellin)
VSALRVVATVLTLAMAILLAAQYASAASGHGHQAGLRHAPRTPPGSARVAIEASIDSMSVAPLPTLGVVSAPATAERLLRPLAAPFVPPRG